MNKKIILFIVIGVLLAVIIAGAIFFYFYIGQNRETNAKVKTYVCEIGEFSTNLGSTRSFFKGSIMLETTDKNFPEKLKEKDSEIRDSIITILIGKKSTEILEPEGQSQLKNEILKVVADILNSDQISKIYFVDYIVQ